MAPPEPQACGSAGCDYKTPESSTMTQMITWMEMHMRQAHEQPNQQQVAAKKQMGQKRKRPMIKEDMSEEDWRFFESEWKDYKGATGVSGAELLSELWACMEDDLKRTAFEQGDKDKLTSEDLMMKKVKELAVTVLHTSRHTVKLHGAAQEAFETTKAFAARVKGLAYNCKLQKTCDGCDAVVSFLDETVYHQVLAGLDNKEMQARCLSGALLGKIKDTATLVEFCNAEEASQVKVNPTVGNISSGYTERDIDALVAGMRSAYSRQKGARGAQSGPAQQLTREPAPAPPYQQAPPHQQAGQDEGEGDNQLCGYCGGQQHSDITMGVRSRECAAYNKRCLKCGRLGHIAFVCKGIYGRLRAVVEEQELQLETGFEYKGPEYEVEAFEFA